MEAFEQAMVEAASVAAAEAGERITVAIVVAVEGGHLGQRVGQGSGVIGDARRFGR